MKKCPFCAEQIQDEAIVCRYCGRDVGPPLDPAEEARRAKRELIRTIASVYEPLLAGIRGWEPKAARNYPLGTTRRSDVIGQVAAQFVIAHVSHPEIAGLVIYGWVTGSIVDERPFTDYRCMAEEIFKMPRTDPNFPTFQEWVSALAFVIASSHAPGRVPIEDKSLDMMEQWRSMKKWDRAARILRGFNPLGAIANLASAFSSQKLPREGSVEWGVCVKACAQAEASLLLGTGK